MCIHVHKKRLRSVSGGRRSLQRKMVHPDVAGDNAQEREQLMFVDRVINFMCLQLIR